ncbi:MAG: response regulator [Deltaproteobacteria bacterium]
MNGANDILVVDDDSMSRDFCGMLLSENGYSVDTASNGAEAVEKLRTARYNLVITDINMPGLTGVELYNVAVWEHAYLRRRFLFMTACLDDALASYVSFLDLHCLSKPFGINDLLNSADGIASRPLEPEDDKRQETRFSLPRGLGLEINRGSGATSLIRTSDISRTGLRLNHSGRPFAADEGVSVSLKMNRRTLEREAHIIRSMPIDEYTCATALQFDMAVCALDLRAIMPMLPID